jgi:hypothetical protein
VTKRPAFLKRYPEKMHRRDQGDVGRGGRKIDREEEGAHVAFKLRRQLINMVPLKGGFVESRVCGQMIRDELQLRALENAKRVCLDVPEGRLWRDMAIRKELQDLPGLVQMVVSLDAGRIHALLGSIFGRIGVPSDMINQARDWMIMQSLIAMGHKA